MTNPQVLFQTLQSLWKEELSSEQPDFPNSLFSLFSPIISVLLLLSSPSYHQPNSSTPSNSIQSFFDFCLEAQSGSHQSWGQDQRCPKRLDHLFKRGDLKISSKGSSSKRDLVEKEISALILALRMREAMVKSWPLIGFPKVISPLGVFTSHFEFKFPGLGDLLKEIETRPLQLSNYSTSTSEEPSRGSSLFQSTYSRHSETVLKSLNHSHPSLPSSALDLIYQPLLSDDSVLSPHPFSTSLICLAICMASGLEPQAKGHFGGAKNCVKVNEERKAKGEKGLEGVDLKVVLLVIKTTAFMVEKLKVGPRFSYWKWLPEEVSGFLEKLGK